MLKLNKILPVILKSKINTKVVINKKIQIKKKNRNLKKNKNLNEYSLYFIIFF